VWTYAAGCRLCSHTESMRSWCGRRTTASTWVERNFGHRRPRLRRTRRLRRRRRNHNHVRAGRPPGSRRRAGRAHRRTSPADITLAEKELVRSATSAGHPGPESGSPPPTTSRSPSPCPNTPPCSSRNGCSRATGGGCCTAGLYVPLPTGAQVPALEANPIRAPGETYTELTRRRTGHHLDRKRPSHHPRTRHAASLHSTPPARPSSSTAAPPPIRPGAPWCWKKPPQRRRRAVHLPHRHRLNGGTARSRNGLGLVFHLPTGSFD
jgi:hypothetical protein